MDRNPLTLPLRWFSVGICKYKPGYISHDLVEITAFRLESKSCKGFFFIINFPPMRALKFMTGHVIYNPAYTYKFQLKTTLFIKPFKNSSTNGLDSYNRD